MDSPVESEREERTTCEKEFLVDLVREQLKKPSNLVRSEPKIEWPEVQRKFNASWICTHAASRYELSKLWRSLRDSPRAKADAAVDSDIVEISSPKSTKSFAKSSAKRAPRDLASTATKKAKKRTPFTPVRENQQSIYAATPVTPEYQRQMLVEIPSSSEEEDQLLRNPIFL